MLLEVKTQRTSRKRIEPRNLQPNLARTMTKLRTRPSTKTHVIFTFKTFIDPIWTLIYFDFYWDSMEGTLALPEDKTTRMETWTKKFLE